MKKEMKIDTFLCWVYQVQKADLVIDHGVGLFPAEKAAAGVPHVFVSGDGCYQVEQNALLGACVDYFGHGTAKLHPDAEMTHDLIRSKSVKPVHKGILLEYGKTGREPDWMEGEKEKLVPKLTKSGKLKYIVDASRHKRGCAVEPNMPSDYVKFKRFCYLEWWDALDAFRCLLLERETLVDHVILPCSLKREPWLKNPVDIAQKA